MHDPQVVAFSIPRPWPQRSGTALGIAKGRRWFFGRRRRRDVDPASPLGEELARTGKNPWPWWKPSSYSRRWVLAGRTFYWPDLITVWHVEPGGRDSGTVCKHYRKVNDKPDGTYETAPLSGWKWHVWHWHIQVLPTQHLKRRLWTRCAGCGHRFKKREAVFSGGWDNAGPRWFRGETNVWHDHCHQLRHFRSTYEEDGEHLLYLLDRITGGETAAIPGTLAALYDHDRGFTAGFSRRRRVEVLLQRRSEKATTGA